MSTKVMLAGVEYDVPMLNIGQLERVTEALAGGTPSKGAFQVLRVAMERAMPKISGGGVNALEVKRDEIAAAVRAVLKDAGFVQPEAAPGGVPNGEAPEGAEH